MNAPRRDVCPSWCTARHGELVGEDNLVHTTGELRVRGVTVRLCAGAQSDRPDGPFVLVGEHEFTLYEAEVLIGALTQLVDLAGSNVGRADPEDPPQIHSPSHA